MQRRQWWVGAVALVALATWWALGQDWVSASQGAGILAVPVAVLALLVAVETLWRGALPAAGDVDAGARRLADKVAAQRDQFLRVALGVTYWQAPADVTFAGPGPGELPDAAERLLVHWQDLAALGAAQEGSLQTIGQFYVDLPERHSGRLVIMGEPGAGKSVLAAQLARDLIAALPSGAVPVGVQVPVWLSLTSCPLTGGMSAAAVEKSLRRWMVKEISGGYGMRSSLASRLVTEQRVLPVFDGLDEMSAAGALSLLAYLNAAPSQPVILVCRSLEYGQLIVSARNTPILRDARHVAVRPLTAAAVCEYLRRVSVGNEAAWRPVIEAVGTGVAGALFSAHPIGEVLANPLRLSFAVMAFRDDSDATPLLALRPDTALTDLIGYAIPTLAEVPTLPGGRSVAEVYGWTGTGLSRWLTHLAVTQHLHRRGASTEYDIVLPDLWTLGGRKWPRWVLPGLIAVPIVTWVAVAVSSEQQIDMALAIVGAMALITFTVTKRQKTRIQRITWPPARRHMVLGLLVGLLLSLAGLSIGLAAQLRFELTGEMTDGGVGEVAFGWKGELTSGLVFGLTDGLTSALTFWLVFGLTVGLMIGLAVGLTREPASVAGCRELKRQCLTHTATFGLVFGLAGGLLFGLVFGLAFGLSSLVAGGLAGGLATGIVVGNGAGWARYGIGTALAARHGDAPHGLARFLDWGLDVGLFRMWGYHLQFRHRDLYIALISDSDVDR